MWPGSLPDRAATPDNSGVNTVRLRDEEYAVALAPGQHRGQPTGLDAVVPDPVRIAAGVGETVATLSRPIALGITILRVTTDLGMRLIRRDLPRALDGGPLRGLASLDDVEPVTLRSGGAEVGLDPEAIDAAFPHATDRIVVFVAGDGETERVWTAHRDQAGGDYGSRLATLLGYTPVYVRSSAAESVAGRGVALSSTLQQLVDHWPTELRRIAVVGHGVGGLVLRAACGVRHAGAWTDLVTDFVALGTPHLVVKPGLSPIGRPLEERLAGITTSDRVDIDVPLLAHTRHTVITAAESPNRWGRFLGAALFWRQTATGRAPQAGQLFPTAERFTVPVGSLPLVNHPDVHHALIEWLA